MLQMWEFAAYPLLAGGALLDLGVTERSPADTARLVLDHIAALGAAGRAGSPG